VRLTRATGHAPERGRPAAWRRGQGNDEHADPQSLLERRRGPEAFGAPLRVEFDKWAKIVTDSGVRID